MKVTAAVVCDLGLGPARGGRARNEDNYLLCHDGGCRWLSDGVEHLRPQEGEGLLAAVFDGMGGHDDGHVASATAARVLSKLYQSETIPERPGRVLSKFVQDAHLQLHRAAAANGPVRMGTTLTAVWIIGARAAWTHVGDSRLYLLRDGQLKRMTTDHTRNEFARRDGRPVTADGDHLAQTFIYGSRGLGHDNALRLDHGLDSGVEELRAGDRLLLCTDGVYVALDEPAIAAALGGGDARATARRVVDEALRKDSLDNVTALIVAAD